MEDEMKKFLISMFVIVTYIITISQVETTANYVGTIPDTEIFYEIEEFTKVVYVNDVMYYLMDDGIIYRSYGYDIITTSFTPNIQKTEDEVIIDVVGASSGSNVLMIYLTDKNKLYTTGYSSSGALGNGYALSGTEITQFMNLAPGELIVDIKSSMYESAVLTSEGNLYFWGRNTSGKAGTGDTLVKSKPVNITSNIPLNPGEQILSFDMTERNMIAVTSENRVFTWGSHYYGNLGIVSDYDILLPQDITSNFSFAEDEVILGFDSGDNTTILYTNKEVYGFGNNDNNQLGISDTSIQYTPQILEISFLNPSDIDFVVTGDYTLIFYNNGQVYQAGQFNKSEFFELNTKFDPVTASVFKYEHINGYKPKTIFYSDNSMYVYGYTGLFSNVKYSTIPSEYYYGDTPYDVSNLFNSLNTENRGMTLFETYKQLALGDEFTLALTNQGTLYAYGDNEFGQITLEDAERALEPTNITSSFNLSDGEKIVDIAAGYSTGYALTNLGIVYSWGRNSYNSLGVPGIDSSNTPINLSEYFDDEKVVDIQAGQSAAIALTENHKLFVWGYSSGHMWSSQTNPTDITSNFDFIEDEYIQSVFLGPENIFVITNMNHYYVWGYNYHYVVSSSLEQTDILTPIDVTNRFSLLPNELIKQVAFTGSSATMVTTLGRVYSWGNNWAGQIGDGTTDNRNNPVEITSNIPLDAGDQISYLISNSSAMYAVSDNGVVFGWGYDYVHNTNYNPRVLNLMMTNALDDEIPIFISFDLSRASYITNYNRLVTYGYNNSGETGYGEYLVGSGNTPYTSMTYLVDTVNNAAKLKKVYIPSQISVGSLKIPFDIYTELDVTDGIQSVTINNVEYTTESIEFLNGRIRVNIPSDYSLNDSVSLALNSITFVDGTEITYTDNNTSEGIVVVDTIAPSIVFDHTENTIVVEQGYGSDELLNAIAIDDTGYTFAVAADQTIDWDTPGEYTVAFTSEDSSGNMAFATKKIVILDNITTDDTTYESYTLYYFGDDVVTSELNLNNQLIRYDNINYYSNADYSDFSFVQGLNKLSFDFVVNNIYFLIGKEVFLQDSDTVPPTFDDIDDITIELGNADVDWTTYIDNLSDNIPYGRIVTTEVDPIEYFVVGDYIVSVSATDAFGNTESKEFKVKVEDTTPPTFDIPDVISIEAGTANVDWTKYITNLSDASLTEISVEEIDSVEYRLVGTYDVSLVATDTSGNQTQKTLQVHVVDTVAPTFEVENVVTSQLDTEVDFTSLITVFIENSDNAVSKSIEASNVDIHTPGEYTIILRLTDYSGNYTEQEVTIIVQDTVSPIISQMEDIDYIIGDVLPDYIAGVTASDNLDGDLTASISYDSSLVQYDTIGSYLVTYTVIDSASNESIATRIIHVIEVTPPEILLNGESMLVIELGNVYVEDGATCSDNYDYTCEVVITGSVLSNVGEYILTYTATDSSGNMSSMTRTITIQDTTVPIVSLLEAASTIAIGDAFIDTGVEAIDLSSTELEVVTDLDVNSTGTYEVSYIVTDAYGNSTTEQRIVHVVEQEPVVVFELGVAATTIELNSSYVDGKCSVTVNGDKIACQVKTNTIDTSVSGAYYIEYSVWVSSTEYRYIRWVYVLDENQQIVLYYRKEEGAII
jgi:alpha-tubulin suppressor-like RCC1 family protein